MNNLKIKKNRGNKPWTWALLLKLGYFRKSSLGRYIPRAYEDRK